MQLWPQRFEKYANKKSVILGHDNPKKTCQHPGGTAQWQHRDQHVETFNQCRKWFNQFIVFSLKALLSLSAQWTEVMQCNVTNNDIAEERGFKLQSWWVLVWDCLGFLFCSQSWSWRCWMVNFMTVFTLKYTLKLAPVFIFVAINRHWRKKMLQECLLEICWGSLWNKGEQKAILLKPWVCTWMQCFFGKGNYVALCT